MKVGDYVRTKYGIIAKINDIIEDLSIDCDIDVYYEDNLKDKMPMMEIPYNLKNEYIIKSSPNIIDLIEVGDYVNGYYVNEITDIESALPVLCIMTTNWVALRDIDIKSIVTKEQFESMKYNLESEAN